MTDLNQRLKDAKRSEWCDREKLPWWIKASYRAEIVIRRLPSLMERQRHNAIERTLQFMFSEGDHVATPHGPGTVVHMYKAVNTNGMGGFVQVDVRYDTSPSDATSYPHVGHYNQIFLDKELHNV